MHIGGKSVKIYLKRLNASMRDVMGGTGLTGGGGLDLQLLANLTAFYSGFSDNFGLTVADGGFYYLLRWFLLRWFARVNR